MRRSYFFHRDPADAFYEPEPPAPECPYCGHAVDELATGELVCGDCRQTFANYDELAREAATMAATPWYSTNGEW